MIGIITSIVKMIIIIVLSILSCSGIWVFFTGDKSKNETICDGVAVCILLLMWILIIVS